MDHSWDIRVGSLMLSMDRDHGLMVAIMLASDQSDDNTLLPLDVLLDDLDGPMHVRL